ncbi:MAG: hypothetical protein M3162_01630 [Thermoproteota archaeon]|nr:hypothetical protein [Thermoproteota archaeon]
MTHWRIKQMEKAELCKASAYQAHSLSQNNIELSSGETIYSGDNFNSWTQINTRSNALAQG